jgi:predicted Zn-dependent protease
MRRAALVLSAALFVISTAAPARAQLGGLGKIKGIADKAADAKGKFDDLNITDKEERLLGDQVSLKLREHFGVYQNEAVTKYVGLVGTALAQASTRPGLDWQFIVLDTDGVNAYAAPGGIVHITRGLLGLMKNESELAGVLGHEITHVTNKHTVHAIQKSKGISLASDEVGGGGDLRTKFIAKMSGLAFNKLFEGEFSREDENDADKVGIQVANKIGYAPNGMVEVLKKIDARNGGREDRNGLFASHPATKEWKGHGRGPLQADHHVRREAGERDRDRRLGGRGAGERRQEKRRRQESGRKEGRAQEGALRAGQHQRRQADAGVAADGVGRRARRPPGS